MSTTEAELIQEAESPPELLDIADMGQFIALLQAWHVKQVATLKHMKFIPAGTTVTAEDESLFTLEGDVLRAFQMGIDISLSHLGDLPFNAEFLDPDATVH